MAFERRLLPILGLALALVPEAAGQDQSRITPEMEEAVQTMIEAGQDPTAGRLGEWVGDQVPQGLPGSGPFQGRLTLDIDAWTGGMFRRTAKIDLQGGPWRAAARIGSSGAGGFLGWETRRTKLVLGRISLRTGYGLLVAGAGRSSSLVADGRLLSEGRGLRGRRSPPDPRTWEGLGLRWSAGRWTVRALQTRARRFLEVSREGAQARTAVAYLQDGGLSWQGTWGCSWSKVTGEAAIRTAPARKARGMAWVLAGSLRPGRHLLFEGGLTASTGRDPSGLGRRVPFLGGSEGKAWALRGRLVHPGRSRLALLISGSDHRLLDRAARRETSSLFEGILVTDHTSTWQTLVRLQFRRQNRYSWSSRYPWQSVQVNPQEQRVLGQIQVTGELPVGRLRLGLRLLGRRTPDSEGSRILWSASFRRAWQDGGEVQLGHAEAWGESLDLVTALAPFRGKLVARHWGQWGSETYLGGSWSRGVFSAGAGLSRRVPAAARPAHSLWSCWFRTGLRW